MNQGTSGHERVFLRRLVLKDYKSIGACDIKPAGFTAFVGPNGAGKSNILDSLRFVKESLRNSLEFAIRDRGGINEVRRRSGGHPRHFAMRLDLSLEDGSKATFSFEIGATTAGGFKVKREECILSGATAKRHHYRTRNGKLVEADLTLQSAVEPDRLYLSAVSAIPEFRPVYDALSLMGFYNINPDRIRDLQDPDPSDVLARDGGNIASILARLESSNGSVKRRIEEYLEAVVPGIKGADTKTLGPKQTVEFRQEVPGASNPWKFLAANMSDGTLRAFGVLVALFQGAPGRKGRVPLVGIEEPESALHPAAAATLSEAILEAASHTQVLVTSHSPELLDNTKIPSDSIMAVVSEKGKTLVAPIDSGNRQVLREGLYTPGELLRIQEILPDSSQLPKNRQLNLFPKDPEGAAHNR